MALKDDEIKHLQWIYWRMIDIHNEKQGVDYMIKFNTIIDTLKQEASGSVAAPKPDTKSECPKCGSYNIIMFTSDDDLCQNCEHTFPGVLGGRLKTTTPKEEETTIGVGDGSSQHFVHGSYDTIKLLQGKLLRMEEQKESIKELLPIIESISETRITPKRYSEMVSRAKALLDKHTT